VNSRPNPKEKASFPSRGANSQKNTVGERICFKFINEDEKGYVRNANPPSVVALRHKHRFFKSKQRGFWFVFQILFKK